VRANSAQLIRKENFSERPNRLSTWTTRQVEAFVKLCCHVGPAHTTENAELFAAYRAWSAALLCQRMSQKDFSLVLLALGFRRRKSSASHWIGICPVAAGEADAPVSAKRAAVRDISSKLTTSSSHRQIGMFVGARCVRDASAREAAVDLYQAYREWAATTEHYLLTKASFGAALRALGLYSRKSSVMFWLGVRMIAEQSSPQAQASRMGGNDLPYGSDYGRIA
jgi:hypothetical protein